MCIGGVELLMVSVFEEHFGGIGWVDEYVKITKHKFEALKEFVPDCAICVHWRS